jgi:hypothetical protein
MSDDMRDRLTKEFAEYDRATTALENAFGFIDDPKEWSDDPEEHAEVWHEASAAAGAVQDAAEALADAARKVALELDLALDEAEA